MERTLILVKVDGVQRRLVGKILSRFEVKGLKIAGLKFRQFAREVIEEHYGEHRDKPFFPNVVGFMTSGPVCAIVLEGPEAVSVCRKLIGQTQSREADPGTIRGDLGISRQFNLVHGSDSTESAEREIALWFQEDELVDYTLCDEQWLDD
jgi:nucleoside-diphosphate kinase